MHIFGHFMRKESLEHLTMTAKLDGKKNRGRQREKITDGLMSWVGLKTTIYLLRASKDRNVWTDMVANAEQQGTL